MPYRRRMSRWPSLWDIWFFFNYFLFIYLLFIYWKEYWIDKNSTKIIKPYKCFPYGPSCIRSYAFNGTICQEGYIGPLCQSCIKDYAKSGGLKCSPCYSKNVDYLIVILMFLAFIIFLMIYLR